MLRLTLLQALICFLFLGNLGLNAQSDYVPNQIIVSYETDATGLEKAYARANAGITNYTPIGDGSIELWADLNFPMMTPSGQGMGGGSSVGEVIMNEQDLIEALGINSNGTNGNERVIINDGDLNYIVELPDLTGQSPNEPRATTQHCASDEYRVAGTPNNPSSQPLRLVVMDQLLSSPQYAPFLQETFPIASNLGGVHANCVTSIIHRILMNTGIDDYELYNVAVFDAQGSATYSDMLAGFYAIHQAGITNAVINLSASVRSIQPELGREIWERVDKLLTEGNNLLISSAGNDSYGGDNVFPGCANISNEITVVGTEQCYSNLWQQSNYNAFHYEIGAESTGILVHDGADFYLADGTSYAAPQVTAAALQVVTKMNNFDAGFLKTHLLATADTKSELVPYVQNGLVLNATTATEANAVNMRQATTGPLNNQQADRALAAVAFQATAFPNPFTEQLNIRLQGLSPTASVHISLIDAVGRPVQRMQPLVAGSTELQLDWQSLRTATPGVYLLRVETDQQVWTQKVIRQ